MSKTMEETEQNNPTLFYLPKDSAQWQPIGEVISTPHFREDEPTEQTHWADTGTFTATVTTDKVNPKLLKLLRGKKQRLSRKMKKAVKQLMVLDDGRDIYVIRKDKGHFNTKWLRKGAYNVGRYFTQKMLRRKTARI